MNEIDEKIQNVYEKLDVTEGRVLAEIERLEQRTTRDTNEKLNALKDLINTTTTARNETLALELHRIQKDKDFCSGNCANTVKGFNKRITDLETWKTFNWQRVIMYAVIAGFTAIKIASWIMGHPLPVDISVP